ncbi:MnhB domain-containing protein [Actinomadura sp. NPDC047616]|uniref:MnhB domain-containing protein n=1 Tax=Actinomadura sp. NPDC047616 TaxID=3155914 RepID=UPI0033C31FFA
MNGRARLTLFTVAAAGLATAYTAGTLRLPGFGTAFHPYGDRAVRQALDHATANTVSSVNFDQRAFDTVGEELILIASALGTVVLLRAVGREEEAQTGALRHGPAEVFEALRVTGLALLPVTLLVGAYVVAHGHLSPGGGFQGGVLLGTALHMLYLAGDYPSLRRLRPIPAFETGEALAAGAFVILALAAAGQIIPLNTAVGVEVGCAMVLLLAKFFEQALLIRQPPDSRPDARPGIPPGAAPSTGEAGR